MFAYARRAFRIIVLRKNIQKGGITSHKDRRINWVMRRLSQRGSNKAGCWDCECSNRSSNLLRSLCELFSGGIALRTVVCIIRFISDLECGEPVLANRPRGTKRLSISRASAAAEEGVLCR